MRLRTGDINNKKLLSRLHKPLYDVGIEPCEYQESLKHKNFLSLAQYFARIKDKGIDIMILPDKVITIAGQPYSKKKLLAGALAKKLGYFYLETGLLYRALAYGLFEQDVIEIHNQEIDVALENLHFKCAVQEQCLTAYYNNTKISLKTLYHPALSQWVALLSQEPYVRQKMIFLQHAMLHDLGPLVVSGLDAGSVVFPQAFCKIYAYSDLTSRAYTYCDAHGVQADEENLHRATLQIKRLDEALACQGIPLKPTLDAYRLEIGKYNLDENLAQSLAHVQMLTV